MISDSVSVVIPCYNQQADLDRLVDRLLSLSSGIQIIGVDDGSTPEITAPNHVELIRLDENRGPSYARNAGLSSATGKYYVCIDADVTIDSASFERTIALLASGIDIVVGTPRPKVGTNFFERYKNSYLNYQFSRHLGSDISFIYGGFCAFLEKPTWPEKVRRCEDNLLGIQLAATKRIALDSDVLIEHHKRFDLWSLLKYGFMISYSMALLPKVRSRHGVHNSNYLQLLAILLVGIGILSLAFDLRITATSLLLWGVVNLRFFRALKCESARELLFSVGLTLVDQFMLGLGIVMGTLAKSASYKRSIL